MLQWFVFCAEAKQTFKTIGKFPDDFGKSISSLCKLNYEFEISCDTDTPLVFAEKTRGMNDMEDYNYQCNIKNKFPKLHFYKNKKRRNNFLISLDRDIPVKSSIAKYIFSKGYTVNYFISENSDFIISNRDTEFNSFSKISPNSVPFGDIVNSSFDISVFTTKNGVDLISGICPAKAKKLHLFSTFILISIVSIIIFIKRLPTCDFRGAFLVFDEKDKIVFNSKAKKVDDFTMKWVLIAIDKARKDRNPHTHSIKVLRNEEKSAFLYVGGFPFRRYVIGAYWYEKLEDGDTPKFKCTYESQTHGLLTPPHMTFTSYRDYRPVHINYTLDNNVKCTAELPVIAMAPFQPHGQLVVTAISMFYDILRRICNGKEETDIAEYAIHNRDVINAIRIVVLVDKEIKADAKVKGAKEINKSDILKFIDMVKPGNYKSFNGIISSDTSLFISRLNGIYYETELVVELPIVPQLIIYTEYCLPLLALCFRFIIHKNYVKNQKLRLRKCLEQFNAGKNISICEVMMKTKKILHSSRKEYEYMSLSDKVKEYEEKGFVNFRQTFDEIMDTLSKGENVQQKVCIQRQEGKTDVWHLVSAIVVYDNLLKEDIATMIFEEITQERKQELMMLNSLQSVGESLSSQNFFMLYIKDGAAYMYTPDIFTFLGVSETLNYKLLPIVYHEDIDIYNNMINGNKATIRLQGRDGVKTFTGIGDDKTRFLICIDSLTEVTVDNRSVNISPNASTAIFWLVDSKDDTVHPLFMQPTVWDLVGLPSDTPFSCFVDKIHPDDRDAFTKGYSEVINSVKELSQWSDEIRIMKAGRGFEWYRIAIALSDNGIVHCLAMNTNQQREFELKLKETRQLRDLLLSSGKLALWKFSNNNREAKVLHQFIPGVIMAVEMNWTFINEQIPEEYRNKVTTEIKKAIESGSTVELEFPIILDDSSPLWVSARGKGDAATQKVLGVCIDITEQKNALDRLQEERKKAEEANKQKTLFLANMSHEIRTPMNGIFGMLDVLSLQEISSEQRLLVDSIRSSSFQLMKLLDDTLHLSKIEQGETEIELSVFSIWKIIEPTIIANYTTAKERGVRLILDVEAPFPSLIRADQQLFIKVFNNLVSNAIKFTKQGHIDIRLSYSNDMLKLVVSDTGIGISKDQQKVIFERFQQADSAVARFFGGTGLGLALVQEIAKFLGGDVTVESEVGKGATFTVTLPFEDVEYPYRAFGKRKKVVFVYIEDDIIKKQVITACKVLNYETKVIDCPDDFKKNVTDDTVALFFENSKDNGKMIKDVAERIGKVSVCAITDPGETCIFKYNITRPAMFHHISKFLDELCHGTDIHNPELKLDKVISRRCLVVEDNEGNQFVMKKMLKKLNCTLSIANNGAEAIDKLNEEEFDIVFMDCQMPVLDGLEATRRIRKSKDKKYHQIPIVALTASAVEGDEEECISAGMDAYLPKPVRLQQITEIIKRFSQH